MLALVSGRGSSAAEWLTGQRASSSASIGRLLANGDLSTVGFDLSALLSLGAVGFVKSII
jgi:hypothetical protein